MIGQVLKYLEELGADRYCIRSKDKEDVNKIRAKIIIGCLEGDIDQLEALRRLNGHLHRIEIITFDQLVRIAGQVVKYLQSILPAE